MCYITLLLKHASYHVRHIDGKKNTKSCDFHLDENTVNKTVNTEIDNKESISEKL